MSEKPTHESAAFDPEGRYDPHLPATKIIAKWGSNNAFAVAIDRTPSTTYRWLKSGYVPAEHLPDVFAAARRDGITIEKDDLIDLRLFEEPEAPLDEAA